MLDINGKQIGEVEMLKEMKKNSLFKTLSRKAKKLGYIVKRAIVKDDKLCVWLDYADDVVIKLYIDGFDKNSNEGIPTYRFGNLMGNRCVSIDNLQDLDSYTKKLNDVKKFCNWLSTTDFRTLYTVSEKTDNTMADGSFNNLVTNSITDNIHKVLETKYQIRHIILEGGVKIGNDIWVVTKNEINAKKYFTPKFDLHLFRNNELITTYTDKIVGAGSYSDFIIAKVLPPTSKNGVCNVLIRKVDLVGYKHHKIYNAIWELIKNDKNNYISIVKHDYELVEERSEG